MKKNMGNIDRIIRAAAAIGFLALGLANTSWLRYLFFVIALMMALTSFVAVCPMYYPMGMDTTGAKSQKKSLKQKGRAR